MGKAGGAEEQQPLPARNELGLEQNVESVCCGFGLFNGIFMFVGIKCVSVLVLSLAVFLSAVFWLPPFIRFADQGDLDLDSRFKAFINAGHDIVARFNLNKSVSFLEDNIVQLEDDIFEELSIPSIKVVILSIEPSAGPNMTKVVFGVDPDREYSKLSATIQSLVRAAFESFVVNETSLQLTKSLFCDSFSFEVLKFPGGITIIPTQSAFLLQKVQIFFNFTLNYSIYQLRVNFAELRSQLKEGLHLASYENVYIRLSNSKGSTVALPTIVQSSVLLAIGYPTRLKQLAQTIVGHSKNLGLNHTVFGKVKQVRLSSILQHSLHGGEGSAPTPAPLSHPSDHHHHHHHHHENGHLSPAVSPAPATKRGVPVTRKRAPLPSVGSPAPAQASPAPHNGNEAKPPGCRLGHKRRATGNGKSQSHLSPTVSPIISPRISAPLSRPAVSPKPARAPISLAVPAFSPLPSVVFAHSQPPSKAEHKEHSDSIPSVSPSQPPSPSSAGIPTVRWAFPLFKYLTKQRRNKPISR